LPTVAIGAPKGAAAEPSSARRALTYTHACRSSIVRTAAQHVPRGCVPSAQLLLSAWTGQCDAMAQHALPFYEMALSVDAGHLQQSVGAAAICTASSNAARALGRRYCAFGNCAPHGDRPDRVRGRLNGYRLPAAGRGPVWTQWRDLDWDLGFGLRSAAHCGASTADFRQAQVLLGALLGRRYRAAGCQAERRFGAKSAVVSGALSVYLQCACVVSAACQSRVRLCYVALAVLRSTEWSCCRRRACEPKSIAKLCYTVDYSHGSE
jgi:hypothetical protein